MNDKLEEVLAEVVEKGITLAEKTGEFIIDQAPDMIQQFYAWQLWSNIMYLVFAIIIFLSGRYIPYLWLDKEDDYCDGRFFKRYGDSEGGLIPAYIIFLITSILSLAMGLGAIYNIIYVSVAPKLYIIDYFLK